MIGKTHLSGELKYKEQLFLSEGCEFAYFLLFMGKAVSTSVVRNKESALFLADLMAPGLICLY